MFPRGPEGPSDLELHKRVVFYNSKRPSGLQNASVATILDKYFQGVSGTPLGHLVLSSWRSAGPSVLLTPPIARSSKVSCFYGQNGPQGSKMRAWRPFWPPNLAARAPGDQVDLAFKLLTDQVCSWISAVTNSGSID